MKRDGSSTNKQGDEDSGLATQGCNFRQCNGRGGKKQKEKKREGGKEKMQRKVVFLLKGTAISPEQGMLSRLSLVRLRSHPSAFR